MRTTRQGLVVGALAVTVAVGAGAAIAATGGGGTSLKDDLLADVAKRLGISEERLRAAFSDAWKARLEAAVEDGKLTEEEAERLQERFDERGFALPGLGTPRPGGPGLGSLFGLGHGLLQGAGDVVEAAADYLGLTEAELLERLRDGDSLADVAEAEGKSVDGLEAALREATKAELDEAVEDGVLTREQADRLGEALGEHVDDLVQGSLRLGPGLGRGHGLGKGFGFGLGKGAFGLLRGADDLLEAAAKYLGVSEAELREALRDGRSLADVAEAEGKSVAGLQEAIRGSLKAELDQAVEDDTLTQEQADRIYDELSEHVDELVEGGLSFRFEFRGGPKLHGFPFHFGPGGGEREQQDEQETTPQGSGFELPAAPSGGSTF